MSPLKLIKLKKGHRPQIKITTKLESFYSRFINQKVDLNEYKTKVNSDYKSVMGTLKVAKSLKQRVLDISKLNNQITKISSINKFSSIFYLFSKFSSIFSSILQLKCHHFVFIVLTCLSLVQIPVFFDWFKKSKQSKT